MAKNTKTKEKMNTIVQVIMMMGLGVGMGLGSIWILGKEYLDKEFFPFLFAYAVMFLLVYAGYMVHIIVHEGGHLICGLLSGYEFTSFRVLSLTLAKYSDGCKLKWFSIPGTAGQCLLNPPEYDDGKYPYKFYLAGGVLANMIECILFVILGIVLGLDSGIGRYLMVQGVLVFVLALMNGIPMKANGVANDGYDVFSINEDKEQKYALWVTLRCNAASQKGTRPKDFVELQQMEITDDMIAKASDPAIIMKLNMKIASMLDSGMYEKVREVVDKILEQKDVMEIYRNEFKCERLFLAILMGEGEEQIESLHTKEVNDYIKLTSKTMISRSRLLYAYELLYKQNEEAAQKYLLDFQKKCKHYPNLGEIKQEQFMMEEIQRKKKGVV